MKAVVRKVDVNEALDSLYTHSKKGKEEVYFIPGEGCIQCIIDDGRKRAIDLSDP